MSDLESGERGVARLPVQLDGVLLGRVPEKLARSLVDQLRYFKVVENGDPRLENTRTDWVVPPSMEIDAVLDYSDKCFPGIRLYTEAGRMVRPVRYLLPEALRKASQDTEFMEMLGPCEQTNMEIAVAEDDFRVGETTHMEYAPEAILSMIAGMTPFSDFNQSPRNMYQCQMGKQTMGTPCHSFQHRTDNKMYRIQNPQRPLVYNDPYSEYAMNEYPMGTNAVVAVISYTGYDMEDACIINKSSYERGFMHASVYKTARVDLGDLKAQQSDAVSHIFRSPAGQEDAGVDNEFAALDTDGLPFVGDRKNKGDPIYNVHSEVEEKDTTTKYKSAEACAIDEIRLNGGGQSRKARLQKVSFKYRLNRNPVIGDKFASRHGQKGVLSMLWPQQDMPFTEHGMYPDLIINPHAFPSRMTIGMLIESLAGKSAALHGIEQNSTPFQYRHTGESDTDPGPVEYFGEQLAAAGFNYAGTEPLYSGVSGQEMKAEIYIGVIYYQRLRHMVKDKFQVRATGPVNRIHRQPVKGRKVGGGIRFGEMERDSMLGHGTSFLLHDRLMACSDYHVNYVCKNCGSALSASQTQQYVAGSTQMPTGARVICRTCASGADVVPVALPFVFLYLLNELAAMNIKLTLEVK
jgi:DNA-directed RNA polymerase I subunit RPA2